MIFEVIHCIECPRPVHPERGGAWCAVHLPVDLTGGVAPSDVLASRKLPRWAPERRGKGGKGRMGRPQKPAPEINEWAALYRKGMSAYKIGLITGNAPSWVLDSLRRHGVAIRGVGPHRPKA